MAPGEAQEMPNEGAAVRRAEAMSRDTANAGALAFRRSGDPNIGSFAETTLLYFASVLDCRSCLLRARCCPKMPARRIPRSIYEEARDVARALAKTKAFERSRRDRKRVEMLFAHLKRILRLGRLRSRGPRGAQFEFTLAAIAQNLRRLAKLVARPPPIAPAACVA